MQLTVLFKNQTADSFIINLQGIYLGTKHIDIIRNNRELYIPIEKINGEIGSIKTKEYVMRINEKDARELNICTNSGEEIIHVEENSLNELFELKPCYHTHPNEEIPHAWMEWRFNYKKAIEFIRDKSSKK